MVTMVSENFAPMRTGTYPRKATMARILIVEDEESYREPLVYQLTREGYDVSAAATGEEGLELFTKGGIDLVLLDLMLPGIDGTALCRRIREQSRVPIIMLTAKSAEIDKVVGLEIGADDYVTKPYSFRELLARIRAVMRRNQATAQASGTVDDDIPLVCGDIAMQVGQHQVTVRGETVFFPLKEFELLEYLMQNKGRVHGLRLGMFRIALQSEQPCAIADDLLRGDAVRRENTEIERAFAFGEALSGCVVDKGQMRV